MMITDDTLPETSDVFGGSCSDGTEWTIKELPGTRLIVAAPDALDLYLRDVPHSRFVKYGPEDLYWIEALCPMRQDRVEALSDIAEKAAKAVGERLWQECTRPWWSKT